MDHETSASAAPTAYAPPQRKSDQELLELLSGEVVVAVGVPQGQSIVEEQPETLQIRLVRRGGEFVELDIASYTVWADALIPRTKAELAKIARERWPDDDVDATLTSLYDRGLLAVFDAASSWEAWSRRLRVLPLAVGLGNSADDLTTFLVQRGGSDLVLAFNVFSYWNWLFWDGTSTVYDAALEVASQLGVPDDVILQHARGALLGCLNAGFLYLDSTPVAVDQIKPGQ